MADPKERSAQLLWTTIILMFFSIQAIIWTVAISITANDSSHAVVAGYDEQALSWDEVKKARQLSDHLGWLAQISVDSTGDIRGNRGLTVQVKDRDGNSIPNANVQLRAFHRGAAGEPQLVAFDEIGPGVYASTIRVNRFGKWCFAGTVTVDEDVLLIDQTVIVSD